MTSSRMKTGPGPAARPHWHHIEVAVPAQSPLEIVAGGLPGREPPQASRLVDAIAAAVRAAADGTDEQAIPQAMWLVAPSRRVGNQWLETLARTGRPTANVHVTTMSALAYDIVAETLALRGTQLASRRAKLVAVEQALVESIDDLRSLADAARSPRRLAERVLHSLESLRNAGLTPAMVSGTLRTSADKAHDIALLLDRYAAKLGQMKLVDQAAELLLATEHVRAGRIPALISRLLVPAPLELCRLEQELLDALTGAGVDVCLLETDGQRRATDACPPVPSRAEQGEEAASPQARRPTIFRAAGEANEVRFIIRTCLEHGLRFDEVEIVHTDATTYPALVREIVAALPLPTNARPEGGSEDHLPVTFAEGLPLAGSKPGRALTGWLGWQGDGHPQPGLERMLREGLLELDPRTAKGTTPDAPQPRAARPAAEPVRSSSLVRTVRGIKIGRGLGRTVSMVAASLARAREQPPERFARGSHDDDDTEDPSLIGPEQLLVRKQRAVRRLETLDRIVRILAACEGGPDRSGPAVLEGARRFLEELCPADSEFDGNARRLLLDEISGMLAWYSGPQTLSARDALDWLAQLPAEIVVLGAGPRTGCLHVSSLATGGHSGRPYTFVVGLDENRFPGGGASDPVLNDGDRAALNAADPTARLSVTRDATTRNLDLWRQLLARLRGGVWLGFSCRDTSEDAEVFPSSALLAVHADAMGAPLATVDDLLRSLPPPETFAPVDPDAALDESQWWLATLGADATPAAVTAALAAHRDHLAEGQAAAAARASADFTPHDGHVPAAGPLLDPRAHHGRTASAHSLETLGTCPRRFFFRYGLGVEPLEVFDDDADRWLTPLDAGSVLHTVLERFIQTLIDRAELPDFARHHDELLAILDDELEANRRAHPPLTEVSFTARRAEFQVAMRTFLQDEEQSCRETGMRPVALEVAIGMEPAAAGTPFDCREPIVVPLGAGESIRLRGRIDRIDARDTEGGPVYALWDYKNGSVYGFPSAGADDPFNAGRKLQHGLYILMVRQRLGQPDAGAATGAVERFGYFFPSRVGKGRRLQWTSDQLAGCTALVRQLAEIVRAGAFLPTSKRDDCSFCDFSRVCGDAATLTRHADRMRQASPMLEQLFTGLRSPQRAPQALERRDTRAESLSLTPHPPAPATPPDEPARQRIREDLGTTLLVEAAAGTGKTTCMVDRMLALVRTGTARPEGIVAVTFTRKAAGELRRRFREKLQQASRAAADPVERDRLAAALDRIDAMVIGTIHSFAARLLRDRPLEAGVDPGFRELDDSADRLLRRQAWREFVTAAPTDHADLLAQLDHVGLRIGDFSRIFLDRFATYGDVESWPAPQTPPPDGAALTAALEPFVARIETAGFVPPTDRGSDELMNSLEAFARLFRRCDTSSTIAVMEVLLELNRSPKVTQGSWPGTGETSKAIAESRKALAHSWQRLWDDARDTIALPALWQWRAHRYPLAVSVLTTALGYYDRRRAGSGVLSFQDLLGKAAALLARSPDVRRSFRSRYTHILVDEFQDTDPLQAQLLVLLAADDPTETDWRRCTPAVGSLFVVGDPKQSLYRFRRADIVTYSMVRRIIEAHGDVLALTTNFRSRGDLVQWTNDIFAREFPPHPTLESPSFTPSASGRREAVMSAGDQPGDWLTGLRTLRFVRAGTAGAAWAEQEAAAIAAFIRSAIDRGLKVPRTESEAAAGLSAACRPGDFLVIPRERRHLGIYAAALHAEGLPVDVTGTRGEDQAESLRNLRDCLAAVADSDDPVAALALLRGDVFGFSDADLHAFTQAGGTIDGSLVVPDSLTASLRDRFAAARDALRRWRKWMRELPVAAALERIIDDAGLLLLAVAAAGHAGPRGRAVAGVLQKYVEAVRADRTRVAAIHDCLDLLDDMIDSDTRREFDSLPIDASSTDRVRVMNLHKAKGLEAPVVFLADYQMRETGEHPEDGPFLHIDRTGDRTQGWLAITSPVGRGQRIIAAPPDWPAFCARERAFEQAEQIRLDYVAATRPGCCLVVSLFEKHDAGTKTRPETFTPQGAWARFGAALDAAPALPALPAGSRTPISPPRRQVPGAAAIRASITARLGGCLEPTFARISPREVLTEPAESMRFTGDGLGEPWGRAIHRLLELAARRPDLDLTAAAASALSAEEIGLEHLDRAVDTVRSVLASDIWRRAAASQRRLVEVPFSIQVRGADLPETVRQLAGDGVVLPTVVRGVIDLVFREPAGAGPDRWTVVDWKTDAVAAGSAALLDAHYRPQVTLYADCWSKLTYNDRSPLTPDTPS